MVGLGIFFSSGASISVKEIDQCPVPNVHFSINADRSYCTAIISCLKRHIKYTVCWEPAIVKWRLVLCDWRPFVHSNIAEEAEGNILCRTKEPQRYRNRLFILSMPAKLAHPICLHFIAMLLNPSYPYLSKRILNVTIIFTSITSSGSCFQAQTTLWVKRILYSGKKIVRVHFICTPSRSCTPQ